MLGKRYSPYHTIMQRDPTSHKGENGKVAIIGGSRTMHGAPLFSALAAEASGVDLVYVCLPQCHAEVAKATSLNVQIHAFAGDDLSPYDVVPILELLATMDSAVLGPGVAHGNARSITALMDIIAEAPCALVLDAAALQPQTLSLVKGNTVVVTPHMAELERMGMAIDDCPDLAQEHGVTMILKGPEDAVFGRDGAEVRLAGGNAGLTVGGTGDALAGLIAGLLAQGMEPFTATISAGMILKRAAENLLPDYGYAFGTRRVIGEIPGLLNGIEMESAKWKVEN